MLASISVDVILLPRFKKWSTNFWGLTLKIVMAPSSLKCIKSV